MVRTYIAFFGWMVCFVRLQSSPVYSSRSRKSIRGISIPFFFMCPVVLYCGQEPEKLSVLLRTQSYPHYIGYSH